jgi:hypothetical protein
MMSRVCEISAAPHLADAVQPLPDGSHVDGRAFHTIVLLLCTGALAAAFLLRIDGDGLSLFGYPWLMHCRLYETFGVKCALCGMSRSFSSLAHGDIGAGFRFHPLGPAVFFLFSLEIVYRVYALATGGGPVAVRLSRMHVGLVIIVSAAVLVNWLYYLGGLIL